MSTFFDATTLTIPVTQNTSAQDVPSPLRRTSPNRLAALDAVRVAAALGVIWFHSIESATLRSSGVLGRCSVAFYTLIAILFLIQSTANNPRTYSGFLHFARAKFLRLYVPFLGWSLISYLVLALLHRFDKSIPLHSFSLDTLVSGTVEPLWFIPFIFVALLAVYPLTRWMLSSIPRQITVAILTALLALFLDFGPLPTEAPNIHLPLLGKMLSLTWNRWSAIPWAISLAILWLHIIKHNLPLRSLLALAGTVLLISLITYQWLCGINPALKVLCGISLVLVALAPLQSLRTAAPAFAARLAKLGHGCFGLYFAHMAFVWIARAWANHTAIPICWQRDVMVFLAALAASLLSIESLRRLKSLQWLVA